MYFNNINEYEEFLEEDDYYNEDDYDSLEDYINIKLSSIIKCRKSICLCYDDSIDMLSIQEIDHNMICFETKTLKEINTLSNIINSLSNKSDDSNFK